jgi:predicted ATPase
MKRIVLTGGPGAGKTVISRQIAEQNPGEFVLVPEAATQVYDALQTRWDRLDLEWRRDVQRRIFQLQIEQEQRHERAVSDRVLLLDRGTVDGAAYWPDGPEEYWRDLGTTLDEQLGRYDAVIWMESCAALGLYDGDQSNACRFEDADAAVESGKVLLRLWGGHRNLRHVGAFSSIEEKVRAVAETLAALAPS